MFFSHTIKGQPANMAGSAAFDGTEMPAHRLREDRRRPGSAAGLLRPVRRAGRMNRCVVDVGTALAARRDRQPLRYDSPGPRIQQPRTRPGGDRQGGREDPWRTVFPRRVARSFAVHRLRAVSQGAQQIFDLLPVEEVAPGDLANLPGSVQGCVKTVFYEKDMVARVDQSAPFELQEYYDIRSATAASSPISCRT